jgi:hypothetical protein
VQRDLAIVAAELFQLQPVGGVAGVFAGGVVAVVALATLQRKIGAVSLRHFIKSSLNRNLGSCSYMEPTTGIEPATYSLQNCCSTVELRRHGFRISSAAKKFGAG